jgi:hypothetical protein
MAWAIVAGVVALILVVLAVALLLGMQHQRDKARAEAQTYRMIAERFERTNIEMNQIAREACDALVAIGREYEGKKLPVGAGAAAVADAVLGHFAGMRSGDQAAGVAGNAAPAGAADGPAEADGHAGPGDV